MKTYQQDGEVLTFIAPTGGVVSGTGVKIGDILVIPTITAAQTLPVHRRPHGRRGARQAERPGVDRGTTGQLGRHQQAVHHRHDRQLPRRRRGGRGRQPLGHRQASCYPA